PLFFTHRVEVLRGPGSALYGSYALNGVVAVDTVSPEDLAGKRVLTRLRYGTGTRTFDALAAEATGVADLTLAYNVFSTEGDDSADYDRSRRTDAGGALARFPLDDRRHSSYFFAKVEGKDALAGVTLSLHLQDWTYGTGHGWLYFTPDDGQESMNES